MIDRNTVRLDEKSLEGINKLSFKAFIINFYCLVTAEAITFSVINMLRKPLFGGPLGFDVQLSSYCYYLCTTTVLFTIFRVCTVTQNKYYFYSSCSITRISTSYSDVIPLLQYLKWLCTFTIFAPETCDKWPSHNITLLYEVFVHVQTI